jgi:hypothetical protein
MPYIRVQIFNRSIRYISGQRVYFLYTLLVYLSADSMSAQNSPSVLSVVAIAVVIYS